MPSEETKEIFSTEMNIRSLFMPFQTCMTLFLLWNTNGDVVRNVHAALFHNQIGWGLDGASKRTKKLHKGSQYDSNAESHTQRAPPLNYFVV